MAAAKKPVAVTGSAQAALAAARKVGGRPYDFFGQLPYSGRILYDSGAV